MINWITKRSGSNKVILENGDIYIKKSEAKDSKESYLIYFSENALINIFGTTVRDFVSVGRGTGRDGMKLFFQAGTPETGYRIPQTKSKGSTPCIRPASKELAEFVGCRWMKFDAKNELYYIER